MVNLILKFASNPKKKDQLVSFYKKKICFLLSTSTVNVVPGEHWECFLWADRGKFYLVKPFRKVEEADLSEAQARVDSFNADLVTLERYKSADFDKIVFDTENKPYLRANKSKRAIIQKYDDYVVKEVEGQVWARPILNDQDRKDYRAMPR